MDFSVNRLPYEIPGPAGSTSSTTPSQSSTQASKALNAYFFLQSPWQELLLRLKTPPHGQIRLTSSIALLRSEAMQQKLTRFRDLPVVVTSLSWVGRNASVTLADPSGSIHATFHEQIFCKYVKSVEEGAAVLLDDVAAVLYIENKPTGFLSRAEEGLHLCVQVSNVKDVFTVRRTSRERKVTDLSRFRPTESYEAEALNPPLVQLHLSKRVRKGKTALQADKKMTLRFKQRNKQRRRKELLHKVNIQPVHVRRHGVQRALKESTRRRQESCRKKHGNSSFHSREGENPTAELNKSVNSTNDDEFDALLSAFDIDGAIEASGKSHMTVHSTGKRSELCSNQSLTPLLNMDHSIIDRLSNKSDDSDFM